LPISPRIRRLIGHSAMSGAIGAALRGLHAAIGEFLACRVANWPAASAFVDLLQPELQHFPDLGLGERPCGLPFALDGGNSGSLPRRSVDASDRRPAGSPRARPRSSGRRAMDVAGELDADPVRLADDGVARRRAERRSNGARAFSFERHLPQSLNRRIGPHIPRPPLLPCSRLVKNVASLTPRWPM